MIKIAGYAIAVVLLFVALGFLVSFAEKLGETVDAGEIVIIQDPIDGTLHIYTEPGFYYQNFGSATHYRKSFQYWFSAPELGHGGGNEIKVRFNDGGHGFISGSVRAEFPTDTARILDVHTRLGSQHAVEQELIRTVIEKAIYMTGPLMSSKESYADKRNELINYIEDQAARGVYKTVPRETRVTDPMTGTERTVTMVEISHGDTGEPLRQEESPLLRFGFKLFNLSINSINYDESVENQIRTQQQAIMEVQTAMAEAKKAEQRAITTEKEGQANAAKAKWEQETIKAKAMVQAEQSLEVARLEKRAAEEQKQREILLGQGEAERKRLIMAADGALKQKLDAWIEVNRKYAEAIASHQGAWVPSVVMGQAAGASTNPAADLVNLMMVKTAKDLSLDMAIPKSGN